MREDDTNENLARSPDSATLPGALADPKVLHALFDGIVDHVYLYDSKKRFRFVSKKALEALGLTADEMLGKTWQEVGLDRRAMEPFECELDTVLRQRGRLHGSTSYRTVHGERTFEYVLNSIESGDGNSGGVLVTATDTSNRVVSELKQSRAELESIYTHAPIGLAVFDKELRFVRVNERLAEINGYSVREHLGRVAWELLPDLKEAAEPLFRKVLETGEGIYDFELSGVTPAKPGVERTWIEHYVPLKSHSGEVIGINAVVAEVTELRAAEQSLKRAKKQLEATLTATDIGTWRWDVENDVFEGDRNLRRLFGMPDEEASTPLQPVVQRLHEDDRERVQAAVRTCLEQGGSYDEEYRVVWPDGTVRWIHARGRVETDTSGRGISFPGVVLDVTERKEAEQSLQQLNNELERRVHERTEKLRDANDQLKSFLNSASHDLRAPLRGIDGFSKVLLDEHAEQLDEAGRSYLMRIRQGAWQIGEVLNDLLELSRFHRKELRPVPLDVSRLAAEAADRQQRLHSDRNVQIVIQPGLATVADEEAIRTLLEQLLDNAWKFTREESQARVEVGATVEPGSTTFYVRDNGVGFDERYAEKLFVPFQSLHSLGPFQRAGIGLALVDSVVRRHGGEVWGEGAVGEGATFFFTIGTPRGKE